MQDVLNMSHVGLSSTQGFSFGGHLAFGSSAELEILRSRWPFRDLEERTATCNCLKVSRELTSPIPPAYVYALNLHGCGASVRDSLTSSCCVSMPGWLASMGIRTPMLPRARHLTPNSMPLGRTWNQILILESPESPSDPRGSCYPDTEVSGLK